MNSGGNPGGPPPPLRTLPGSTSFSATSIDGVVDITHVRGAASTERGSAVPDLVIEVPHGATRRAHFDALRAQLKGPFPDDLVDFFFVNTDVGAPETALALAEALVHAEPHRSVTVLRCQIPRTFIDCNRIIEATTVPTTSTATGMTPGVVRYVQDPADLALLFQRYSAYRRIVEDTLEEVCGQPGGRGLALMLHSYAPRSVDVEVDENIVQRLHAAYAKDVEPTWPLRPEVDLITTTPDGVLLTDARLVASVKGAMAEAGVVVADSVAYPLHPSSLAHTFASRWPAQCLCLELRRDLLVQQFTPFAEMTADDGKVARFGGLLADGLRRFWALTAAAKPTLE